MNFLEKFGLVLIVLVHLRVYCVAGTCNDHQFQCDDGSCIPMIRLCNGQKDCNDDSDENRCRSEDYPKCKSGYFQCVSDRHCIPFDWACDDDEDCIDDSDEKNCSPSSCNKNLDFECLSTRDCIPKHMHCDGKYDCDDGSDERNCEEFSRACLGGNILCEDGHRCIPREWMCDSDNDCDDGSDEKQCDYMLSVAFEPDNIPSVTTTPGTELPGTAELSCPDDYCKQNADCFVIKGQYRCHCPPSFTGKMCELRITAERDFQDLGIVIGVAMTLIILFIFIALMFFCYYKRNENAYLDQRKSINRTLKKILITTEI
ncbi:unnamed protein product [Larinioides sclopetarius]|uniref:EGF-like domain-containing protein n=1 Tax=Larinioides sclopetarius TaxID=280406 RepID=A0AAV2AIW9_9ARAC